MSYLNVNRTTQIYNPLMGRTSQVSKNRNSTDDRHLMLLAWEINFINTKVNYNERTTIVYIGESTREEYDDFNQEVIRNYGTNIRVLSEMYEFITFHVFDHEEFSDFYDEKLKQRKNVVVYGRNITEEDMDNLVMEPNLYVISNWTNLEVRNEKILNYDLYLIENGLRPSKENEEAFKTYKIEESSRIFQLKEDTSDEDFEENRKIVARLNPICSLVKFRIPHKKMDQYSYMNGTLFLPIFSGYKSLETRLIVVNPNLKFNWNFAEIREIINYWNSNERQQYAMNPFTGFATGIPQISNGMEYCILFSIIKDYFATMDVDISQEDAVDFFFGTVLEK